MAKKPTRLTDLELELMQVVWDAHPEPLTVRAVVDSLADAGRPFAYTTIQTMLNILCKKGALVSRPGPGRAHEYRAVITRREATSTMTRDFVERLFGGRATPLFAQLLEHESMSREELRELARRIEEHLQDEQGGEP
jgi:predicted transcriptional regulator